MKCFTLPMAVISGLLHRRRHLRLVIINSRKEHEVDVQEFMPVHLN